MEQYKIMIEDRNMFVFLQQGIMKVNTINDSYSVAKEISFDNPFYEIIMMKIQKIRSCGCIKERYN